MPEIHIYSDPKHPSYKSGGREGAWAGLLIFVLGIIFFNVVDVAFLSREWKLFLLLIVSLLGGGAIGWIFISKSRREQARFETTRRENIEAETQKQIDAMQRKASNIPNVSKK